MKLSLPRFIVLLIGCAVFIYAVHALWSTAAFAWETGQVLLPSPQPKRPKPPPELHRWQEVWSVFVSWPLVAVAGASIAAAAVLRKVKYIALSAGLLFMAFITYVAAPVISSPTGLFAYLSICVLGVGGLLLLLFMSNRLEA